MDEIRLETIGSGSIVHSFIDNVTEVIQFVAVCFRSEEITSNSLHHEYARQVRVGKNVICEKPFGPRLEQVREKG